MPQDRMDTIAKFHAAGIPTWVSLEPVLDPELAIEIIQRIHPITDLFKIGKLNYHPMADKIDWSAFVLRSIHICESLNQPYYIKHDLAAFLPKGVTLGPHHITPAELESAVKPEVEGQIPLFDA